MFLQRTGNNPVLAVFVSKFGLQAAKPHMSPGDKFVSSPESLCGYRKIEVHVVEEEPSWLSRGLLLQREATVTWHNATLGSKKCKKCNKREKR